MSNVVTEGRSVELRIRRGGVEVSRPVRLHVGGLICGEERARAGLGWADAGRHLFPQLEAVLEIAPVPHDGLPFTQLGVPARYRPPLGPHDPDVRRLLLPVEGLGIRPGGAVGACEATARPAP